MMVCLEVKVLKCCKAHSNSLVQLIHLSDVMCQTSELNKVEFKNSNSL